MNQSNRYYYHARRVPGGFRCDYLAKGPLAESVAVLVAERKRLRLEAQALRRELADLERTVVQYHDGISELFAAWMRLSGWHRHCGAWRRTGKFTRRTMHTVKELDAAIAAEEARREFEEGNVAEFIEKYGDNAAWNTMNLIISQTTQDAWQREALRCKAALLLDELAPPGSTPVERIMAERVVVGYFDAHYAHQTDYIVHGRSQPLIEAEYLERRRDRADRRLGRAAEELARVRKLETATIQQTIERLRLAV
jgi:hypothetical protein